jgi:ATP-dependent exoDNAse (exonuclease V) alpha subunit
MAIYHLHAKIIQRSKGKNAVAAAAYRHAARMYAEKEGMTFNYENKPDVIHSEILIPNDAPEWLKLLVSIEKSSVNQASEKLWNLVENIEKRKDAQLAREFEFSLPIELNKGQNIQLAREFIQDQFVLRGMIADFSIHWDEGNPHVHVMLSTRQLNPEGFGQKVVAWNSKILLQEWREKWAEYANFHLRMHEHTVRIDHRSYEEQGIALVPGVHEGKAVTDMERRGLKTDIMQESNWIRRENLARICADPHVLLNKITSQNESFTYHHVGQELGRYINDNGNFSIIENGTFAEQSLINLSDEIKSVNVITPDIIATILNAIEHHESVFTDRDLAKAIAPHTENAEMFAQAVVQIKSAPGLIRLGPGDDGRDRFTTRRMFGLENDIQIKADILRDSVHVKISQKGINDVLTNYQNRIGKNLTNEQLQAVKHILKPSSISCVVGRAGTGKSFSLGAAKEVWEAQGLKVHGVALSGIAADGMAKDANIDSRTIESFRYAIQAGKVALNHHSVVVMDEAGMTDSHSMLSVLNAVREARAKLVLVGDHAQIQPVGPGASFRALLERLGFAEIQTVYRQKEQWQRDATVAFSAGRTGEALATYSDKDCMHFSKTPDDAMANLVRDWMNTRANASPEHGLDQYLVVAHRNEDVYQLNQLLRAACVAQDGLSDGYTVRTKNGTLTIAKNDRLLFLKNDRRLGVSNGRFATIQSVSFTESGKVIGFDVILDGSGEKIRINPEEYNDFALGYAATVHKVQGMTVDHTFIYAGGKGWNRHLTYVAMSRHRETCNLYADKETHTEEKTLNKNLSRLGIKDSLLDYPLAFAERRGIDTAGLLKLLPKHLAERLSALKEQIADRYAQRINPELYRHRQEEKIQNKVDAEERSKMREDARLVAAYVDTNQDVGQAWQNTQAKLYELGFDAMPYDVESYSLVAKTDEYQNLQNSMSQRNKLAADIVSAPERYQRAMQLYGLDLNKLTTQAESHACLLRVESYKKFNEHGVTVRRDQLAARISAAIKNHYPHLKALGVDTKSLRQEAICHLRRKLFTTLTEKERATFYTIEKYQDKSKEVGAYYARYIKSTDTIAREHVIKFESLAVERDRLAYEITQHRSTYDKALDFYQIGLSAPHFQETPTNEQRHFAEERWYKLQSCAARYELRDRITQYVEAGKKGLVTERLQLAADIRKESKAHYSAMMQLGMRPDDQFWLGVWKDEQRYKQLEFFKTLDLVDRLAFLTVESYIEAKRSNGAAWSELFETKKVQQMDDATFYNQVAGYANTYTKARNKLAAEIAANPIAYQSSLAYFKLNTEALTGQAYTHQCQVHVDNFANDPSILRRAEMALAIIQDPKAHYKAMVEQGIHWKDIYYFARIAERKALFNQATSEEKRLMRLMQEYRNASRQAGKYYSVVKEQQINKVVKDRMQGLIAKRDALANRIMYIKNNVITMSAIGDYQATQSVNESIDKSRFSWEKVTKHSNQHIAKQQEVLAWHEDYVKSMNQLATISTVNEPINRQDVMNRIIDWSADRQDRNIDLLTQKILSQGVGYQKVLQEAGIHLNQLIQQQETVAKIKSCLSQWIGLDNKQEQTNQSQKLIRFEDKSRINAVRKIIRESKPIEGTLAQRYLGEHRGIESKLNNKTFLYHPNLKNWMSKTSHPALIVLARDKHNQVCGLQAIFLDPITAKKAALGDFAKLSRGFTSEGSLVQLGKPGAKVAFAEGPETALSIAEAKQDWTVYVTFGVQNFEKVALKANAKTIVICADNDGLRSGTERSVEDAAGKLSQRGIDVFVAMPDKPAHAKKWDFNDALTVQGVAQVIKNLDQAKLNKYGATKERLENDVIQAAAVINQQEVTKTAPKIVSADEVRIIEMYDIKSIIKHYVEMEVKQTALVNEMHAARMKDPRSSKEASAKTIKHDKEISVLAMEVAKNPEVAYEIKKLQGTNPATLAQRGGYTAIKERFSNGEFLPEDMQTVFAQIRNKALDHIRTQERDRDRGGRTR